MAVSGETIALLALETSLGPAILCDHQLRVVTATAAVARELGLVVRPGESVVKALCGDGPKRPIAEALARGQAVAGTITRIVAKPKADQEAVMTLDVRAVPLRDWNDALPLDALAHARHVTEAGNPPVGWLLRVGATSTQATSFGFDDVTTFMGMQTRAPAMRRVFHVIERAAKRNVAVLVRGPSGAGKELVANAIHALSLRSHGPFRAINCAALPAALLESELFGHQKGSFTGAMRDHLGIFRAASGGTLFLDEVAELPLELQAKLLRVLETQTVLPVGGTTPIAVDVRIVAATHQSLRDAVAAGRFRADLMYRLRVVPIFLPALVERAVDIPLLLRYFIDEQNTLGRRDGTRVIERIAPAALATLEHYTWPGNIRELRNVLEYAYVVGEGPTLQPEDLPPELLEEATANPSLTSELPAAPSSELNRIRQALAKAGGNRGQAAKMLGLSRVTLWRKMVALGLTTES